MAKRKPQQSVSEWNISNLLIKKNISLSSDNYGVYSIIHSNQKIGCFGVYRNGYFNYAINDDNVDSKQIVDFIESYIRNGLNLMPIEKPKLPPINTSIA